MRENTAFVNFWLCVVIISLAISPVFALGEGNRNLLLIGVMSISPLIIIRYLEFDMNDLLLGLFNIFIVLFPMLNHPETMRWSTVMYSVMFCLNFMAFVRLLRNSNFRIEQYFKILKWLMYAYAIVLLIQQLCVLTDMPVVNLGNYNPAEPWKLNSLTAEPSHTSRIMGLLMYCYITIKEVMENRNYSFRLDFKKDIWVWSSFLWTMLTTSSGTAIIFIIIVLLKFLKIRTLIPFFAFAGVLFLIANFMELKSAERALRVARATLSMDERAVMRTDGSAGSRIVPLITLSKTVTILTKDGWFGHGIDQVSESRMMDFRKSGYAKGMSGTMFTVWYEYGFIAFFIFGWFTIRACFDKKNLLSILFWFMLVFLYGVNNQMVWLCVTLLYANKVFLNNQNEKNSTYCSRQG